MISQLDTKTVYSFMESVVSIENMYKQLKSMAILTLLLWMWIISMEPIIF